MKQLETAFAGFGSGGRVYNAPILKSVPGYVVDKILTRNAANIAAAKTMFPYAEIVSDYNEILNDTAIDLVVIAVPNHLHFEYAQKALEARKHVLIEKPFCVTTAEAQELIALANEKNSIISVNHNRRWDSDFRTVKQLVKKGILGRITECEIHFDRFRPEIKAGWKENRDNRGSGILYDLGSHLIDQALDLFGSPEKIFADIRIQREAATVPDSFEILLFYPELKVSLNASTLKKEKPPTFSLHGTAGSFVKYGSDVQETDLKNGKIPDNFPQWGQEPEESWGLLNTAKNKEIVPGLPGDYRIVYKALYNAIIGGTAPAVTAEQAKTVIKVIETSLESAQKGCTITFE